MIHPRLTALLPAALLPVVAPGRPALGQEAPATEPSRVIVQGTGYAFSAAPSASEGAYVLTEEVSTPALVKTLGGRSARAELTVDCARRQSAIGAVRVYARSGGAGEGAPVKASAWMRGAPVDLFDLTEALCSGRPPTAAAESQPPAAAPVAPAPAAESRAPDAGAGESAAAAAAASAPGRWVQVGAFASAPLAESEGGKLQAKGLFAGASRRVEPVARGGATLYRLLLGPFPSQAAAQAACAAAGRGAGACIVR